MKKYCWILTLLVIACTDHHTPQNDEYNDPNWLMLEIPSGREAYAVTGSIDDTLLVTTWTKAYYTIDQGHTWRESYDFQGPVPGLLERNDTIFSLQASTTSLDPDGHIYATLAQYFTVDYGNSWKYTYHPQLRRRTGSITSSSGIEYFLRANTTPVSAGSNTYYINPTDIMIKSVAGAQSIAFPYKRNILNLHIDSEDRLYIAASGGIYKAETNSFYCCPSDLPAIIYVSKHPLP